MIRTKEFRVSSDLTRSWKKAVEPVAKAAIKDFESWPLYQRAGEEWTDAPRQFAATPSLAAAIKQRQSKANETLEQAANPGLRAMYHNASSLLNVRRQHFFESWMDSYSEKIEKKTKVAMAAFAKREKMAADKKVEGFILYAPNTYLWQAVWERLHPSAVEAPFREHFLTILRAGHFPAGVQGDNWKTCRFLYF